jgi:hypothetical protein
MWMQFILTVCFAMSVLVDHSFAVNKENTDENRVPPYVLPDPLVSRDGSRIKTAGEWKSKRRPEILRLFETEVYGRAPAQTPKLEFHVESENARLSRAGRFVRKSRFKSRRRAAGCHCIFYCTFRNPLGLFLLSWDSTFMVIRQSMPIRG